jgi:hypothetical protein
MLTNMDLWILLDEGVLGFWGFSLGKGGLPFFRLAAALLTLCT